MDGRTCFSAPWRAHHFQGWERHDLSPTYAGARAGGNNPVSYPEQTIPGENRQPSCLQRMLIGRHPRRTAVRLVILVTVLPLIFTFVARPVRVHGLSMKPTYRDGGINFVNRLAYAFHAPKRGDIVAIRFSDEHVMLMKRIIGMPGETIAFQHGRVLIDGHPLEEPYLDFQKYPCDWSLAARAIGPDEYYVVGDNRTMPEADHEKGMAKRTRIVGKILL
jgi:signal peptidase I